MKRGLALLFTLFLPAMGQFLVSRIDAGGEKMGIDLPIVEFIQVEPWKKTRENLDFCLSYQVRRKNDFQSITPEEHVRYAMDCQAHEWETYFVPEDQTKLAGRDLKIFWRRVEERTWWRAETQVNMGIPFAWRNDYFDMCVFRFWEFFRDFSSSFWGSPGRITAKEPPVKTHVLRGHVGESFWRLKPDSLGEIYPNSALSFTDDGLPPPGGTLYPRVDAWEFCDKSGWQPFFWIPGTRTVAGLVDIRIPGDWPRPIYFPYDELRRRYAQALAYANARYQADYWLDLLTRGYQQKGRNSPQTLPLPSRILFALWFGDLKTGGQAIQPTADLNFLDLTNIEKRITQFLDLAGKMMEGYKVRRECLPGEEGCEEDAGRKWKDPFYYKDPIAYIYYAKYLVHRLPVVGNIIEKAVGNIADLSLSLYLASFLDQKLEGKGPGIWKLEEAKRWLPHSVDPLLGEAEGVVTLFQAWTQWDTVILPIPISFHGYANQTNISALPPFSTTFPVPWEYPVGTIAITGPRVHFGWVNVPEGYSVPRVTGAPRLKFP